MTATTEPTNVEQEVLRRYKNGARAVQSSLCCPTSYDRQYLEVIPREILEKDYGCGDPSRYVEEADTVVDLGSGGGKICYILAQKVGAQGRVIGIDFNDEMLNLARKYQQSIAQKLGCDNVTFLKGKIQDLALPLEAAEAHLAGHPIKHLDDLAAFEAHCQHLRREATLVADASVDVVVSNCVLNLVRPADKQQLFGEMFRVLRRGGRAVISDIVCDEDPSAKILGDSQLWSGCIAGAFREDRFLAMFEDAGFYGIQLLERQGEPWQVIDGIEFRSVTVRAFKGKQGPCRERHQAVVYTGPWKQVVDDDGHRLDRGQRMAVCDKTFHLYTNPKGPYQDSIVPIPPRTAVPMEEAQPFACTAAQRRSPRQTKGEDYRQTITDDSACCDDERCC